MRNQQDIHVTNESQPVPNDVRKVRVPKSIEDFARIQEEERAGSTAKTGEVGTCKLKQDRAVRRVANCIAKYASPGRDPTMEAATKRGHNRERAFPTMQFFQSNWSQYLEVH